MKLAQPIDIDFEEFFKYGKFDYIKLSQTKEWIIHNFPDPDAYFPDFLSPKNTIWTYGNIEFHFDKTNKLYLIYSDYLSELNGGEHLRLKKWIFEDYEKLNLAFVLAELNRAQIDYWKKKDRFGIRLRLESGVELYFSDNKDDENKDPNLLMLASFSLIESLPNKWILENSR